MDDDNKLRNLNQLLKGPASDNRRGSTLGLVVDCTAPHRKDPKRDFVMKVKIIDQSENKQPATIFIYGSSLEDFPRVNEIGNILYLKKYQFEEWKNALQGKNQNRKVAAQRVYSGNPDSKTFEVIGETDGEMALTKDNSELCNAILDLRRFSREYFKKNKVPFVPESSKSSSDFDIILNVVGCEQHLNMFKVQLEGSKDKFTMNYRDYVCDGIYKIRSVAKVEWFEKQGVLVGNDYTCFIRIPDWMKSYNSADWGDKLLKGVVHKDAVHKLSTRIDNPKASKLKVTPLQELINRGDHPEFTLIEVEFLELLTPNLEDCLKKYDHENRTEKHYTSEGGQFVYSAEFLVRDSSLEDSFMHLFLYTFDDKGIEFLPGLDTKEIFGTNVLNFTETFENIKNRLLEETGGENRLRVMVSPLAGKNFTIYRIVNTTLQL